MRKFLMGLAAILVVAAVAAPPIASAAQIKVNGIFRFRGVTGDDGDRNSRLHDTRQQADYLTRMRWTFTGKGKKIWGIYETDLRDANLTAQNGNGRFGNTNLNRVNVGINRWIMDAAIPGTTLRFRVGKTDWRAPKPLQNLIGGNGLNRTQGIGIYGKLSSNLSLSLWNTQISEGTTASSDDNDYYLGVTWKAAPNMKITPIIAWEKFGGTGNNTGTPTSATTERDLWYYGLNMQAKFGILDLGIGAMIEDGKLEFSRGVNAGGRQDTKIEGWALLIRSWLNFGKLKVGFYGHFFPGDDDITDQTGDLGTQPDNTLKRFTAMRGGGLAGSGRLDGPQLITRRRYSTFSGLTNFENRNGTGNGGAQMNGSHIYEILVKYKITKSLGFMGNVSLIRSAAKRANIDSDGDGIADQTYDSAKDFGTEIYLSLKYSNNKGFFTRLTFGYLFAGDYGKASGTNARDFDDTWMLWSEMR